MPVAESDGLVYGPNKSGKRYKSLFYHRNTRRDKSTWQITTDLEYDVFCFSDSKNISDNHGNYWGFWEDGKTDLGTDGETVCKFPLNGNTNDPWHGFPVSPLNRAADRLDFHMVQGWIDTKLVSKTFGRRIQRSKV
jgi:hypothetical protein